MLQIIRQINEGRTLLMNAGVFLCVVAMLGLANLFCRFVLHADLSYLMPWLLGGAVLYVFGPPLVLWLFTGRPSDR